MLLELGPTDIDAANGWMRFARRVLCELRMTPERFGGVASDAFLSSWADLIDQWSTRSSGEIFRWTAEIDDDLAAYLIAGWLRLAEQPIYRAEFALPPSDPRHRFGNHVIRSMLAGLEACDAAHAHCAQELTATMADLRRA